MFNLLCRKGKEIPKEEVKPKEFPHERHGTLLKIILDMAHNEYKIFSLEWRNRQNSILRLYLWLSVTILAAQISISNLIIKNEMPLLAFVVPNNSFYFCLIFAILLAFFAFAIGLDTLRGRSVVMNFHISTYTEIMNFAYQECIDDEYRNDLVVDLIKQAETGITHQIKIGETVGRKLRYISLCLLFSLFFSILAIILSYITSKL